MIEIGVPVALQNSTPSTVWEAEERREREEAEQKAREDRRVARAEEERAQESRRALEDGQPGPQKMAKKLLIQLSFIYQHLVDQP